ncbi:CotY/CotZ family spore coat protein [Bacillus sp. CGMCC 1.16607]|uniref:CotY/CotZ family spore coat protein n=1 Tax=Bacillus sp. CGMCC 1.16607 TaxID=3351842 RepID=UPI00362C27AE
MSCRGHGPHEDENCVCGVLRAIVDAQDQVSPVEEDNCDVSCQRSINVLLGDVVTPTTGPNTIPVILYCDCDPFLGVGVRNDPQHAGRLECVQSFLFRVNSVDENCCASLELLSTGHGNNANDPCDQFPGNSVRLSDIEGTGICITVDLNCFCAVTCLDPIRL